MVGIINPDDKQTLDKYSKEAAKQSTAVSPRSEAFGGKVVKDGDDDSKDDDKDDDKNDKDDDKDKGEDGEDAAGSFHVPVLSLLTAVGVAFFMA